MGKPKWFRTYLFIWSGQFVSMLSSYAVQFAIIIWLSLEYKSAQVLAYAGIASILPQAIIGPIAGVYIDRLNRKNVMMLSDAFIAVCTFVILVVLKNGAINLFWIYILLGLRSVGNAFHTPALQAIAPLLVPQNELIRVAGINQIIQSVTSIAGPAIGTLAIASFPISEVLYLDIIGAVLAITSLLLVRIPNLVAQNKGSLLTVLYDLKEGLRTVSQNRGLSLLFFFAMAITLVVMPAAIMFPLLTTGHYGGGKWEMGLIEVAWGSGMLIGGGILSVFKFESSKVMLINTMYTLLGLTLLASGLLPEEAFIIFVIITIVGGLSLSVFNGCFTAIVQIEVVPEKLGRVFSLYFSLAILPSLIGLLFTGWIVDTIGINQTFIICGLLAIVLGLAAFTFPTLMQLGNNKTIDNNEN
ncbi:MFS transporter [Sphingobacterium thermophilum]|uniref:MFS transporter n=1 Tax=Sphingobacterium thermophilum TaxID=768534 RepID=A0ABP8QXP0_9SPHI